tara:strand:- start:149882 stop:150595 length:714 start_codon:yes stop_codon:yes gene_type:complete
MRLNKFLAQSGISSRRKADQLIQMATTTVNGEICLNPAYNVKPVDVIEYDNIKISVEKNKIVILLHKPLGILTTAKDNLGRKTVLDLVRSKLRIFPVGRLDKNSSGVMLLTNDGALNQYLTHPSNQIPKDYEVISDKKLLSSEIKKLKKGIYIGYKEFGQGEILSQQKKKNKSVKIIIRLRQGKKREIRRIMFRLKRNVFSLKRIRFAGIGLGNLSPGQYRILSDFETRKLNSKDIV